MPKVSTEAVQSPTHDGIDLVLPNIAGQAIKGGSLILGPADGMVDVFDTGPASCGCISAEFQ
jgi:hypothetical protein